LPRTCRGFGFRGVNRPKFCTSSSWQAQEQHFRLTKHGHKGLIACLLLELDVKGVGLGTVDVYLGEKDLLEAFGRGKCLDLGVGARLLAAELVAGEPQHSELVGADSGSQLGKFSIVGGSQASCCRETRTSARGHARALRTRQRRLEWAVARRT
jgi:hypothetical protein